MTISEFMDSLLGKTFEDESGKQRLFTRRRGCEIYWRRPGGLEQKKPLWITTLRTWLKTAKDVSSPSQDIALKASSATDTDH
jgi:hypothetical protein